MNIILGVVIGHSMSSAINCFRYGENGYGVRFIIITVLSVVALGLWFHEEYFPGN